jgi:AcrR family transcriptional regulator
MKAPGQRDAAASVRHSRGRPPLPRGLIIDAAIAIVDEDGADALSMRTLAQRLGSGTATLYRHFEDRTDLVGDVVDRIFGEVIRDVGSLRAVAWSTACSRVAHAMFQALARHRNIGALLIEDIPMGPNAMRLREDTIAMLLENGFSRRTAAYSWATLGRYVVGFAAQAHGDRAGRGTGVSRRRSPFTDVDRSRFPATARVAGVLPVALQDEFTFGLDLIIEGLARSQATRARTRSTRNPRAESRRG